MPRLENRCDWVVLLLDLSEAKIDKSEKLWKVMEASRDGRPRPAFFQPTAVELADGQLFAARDDRGLDSGHSQQRLYNDIRSY